MTPFTSKDLQRWLEVEADGQWGERTELAARAKLGNPKDDTGRQWGKKRLIHGIQQAMLKEKGFSVTVDGIIGPETLDAMERYQNGAKVVPELKVAKAELSFWQTLRDWWFKDNEPSPREGKLPVVLPKPTTPAVAIGSALKRQDWPRQKDVPDFYGKVGENQTRIVLPYQMKLAWEPKTIVKTMVCHKKVAPSVLRCLQAVQATYTPDQIAALGLDLYGGCLNVRQVRGGNTWSMHSWGIAIDFDPDRNQLRWNAERARLAKPDAKAFWEIWEAEGWLSLGRERDFDWMHVQAAKL